MPSPTPRCLHCRYDLSGIVDRCPECGWTIDPEVLYLDDVELIARRLQKPAPPSWWRRLLAAYSALVVAFVVLVILVIAIAIVWMASRGQGV
ncbi:MAG: hypothetical protein KF678_12255 [Phycisphaeraceae bacterium]|nr:hypothetical protein [Phycisphaeraceae bacterium]